MVDRDKLLKLLKLASSAEAEEAHSAMRFAVKLLEKNGLTWEKVISVPPDPSYTNDWNEVPFKPFDPKPGCYSQPRDVQDEAIRRYYTRAGKDVTVSDMFDFLRSIDLPDKSKKFINGLMTYYLVNANLTPKQYDKLYETYMKYGGE